LTTLSCSSLQSRHVFNNPDQEELVAETGDIEGNEERVDDEFYEQVFMNVEPNGSSDFYYEHYSSEDDIEDYDENDELLLQVIADFQVHNFRPYVWTRSDLERHTVVCHYPGYENNCGRPHSKS
jgi:hypothetical protein